MIRFINVSKDYHSQLALKNVSFTLQKGEMAFLTGHSGAGKSTILKLISMIEKTNRGQIFINEQNLHELPQRHIAYLRRNIGIIFQNPQLLPDRKVHENVALPLVIAGYRHQEIRKRVRASLDKVGLLNKENHYPLQLSSGEQQRIGIARAIINKPSIVIADEPTGNLDPDLSAEILGLFQAFNSVGVTVLVATHALSLIAPLNYRVLTLKEGTLIRGADNE